MRRHRKSSPSGPLDSFNGLTEGELYQLGTYNAECARGIMHTPGWQARMAALQARFDAAERERFERRLAGGGP